ncbi:Penicillin V acylase [Legionella massiliensis]|uniref:Penicillin V acylase n=1 Tax=Legionella massiliensis TaxID=1034943 RepID=A0A078KZX6_9GAMM|nr:linear amide C-N hydrolase [Legionella massiliensis]CDZ77364.1 Penicillin V acylase [Legionella massiliensis]CEE13102.1 Choloylglycine hydrolase [Legionella massiliensis]
MKNIYKLCYTTLLACSTLLSPADACTRALYHGADNTIITGRSMDWNDFNIPNLWVFPRGIQHSGQPGGKPMSWAAKYGSVVTSMYDLASVDGMNEKGLVMNLLYLAESDYGAASADIPSVSISLWGQYALDNFATVDEAVKAFQTNPVHVQPFNLPNNRPATAHLSLSDNTGDSAIFEFIDGKLVVHHGKQYTVMTNSPIYSQQLALNDYWKTVGGTAFLPGTDRAADRFVRTQFYIDTIPKQADQTLLKGIPNQKFEYQAVLSVLSVIRAVSIPMGITTPNQPNIATTLWRTVADQKNMVYYYDSATTPNAFWVSFDKLNFKEGSPVLKLALDKGQVYSGEANAELKPAESFKFR